MLTLQEVQKPPVVRQVRHIEGDVIRDEGLESRFAVQDLCGESKQQQRVSACQNHQRVDQSVRFDQSSVQIDAERLGV